jgi:TolB-like protein/Tfp pilus assembly protein PilF
LIRLARTAPSVQGSAGALPANATLLRSESCAEYFVREIKQHKRAALAILAVLFCATTAIAIFTLTGTSNAGITSLAVVPFANNSNDPGKDYLTDGISETLTNQLSQIPGIKVIANSSSARYKGKDADPHEIGRALDVTGVLTGRVAQVGDRLSIRVELIDARDRTQVWGEHFDSKPTDLFATQAAIARQITEKLRVRLTAGEQEKLEKSETVNSEAYELVLKGRFHRFRGGLEDRKQAADYFNRAIARDPGYAPAYADLADMYRSLIGSSILDPREYLPKAEGAARKAVELDESLADGHYALASLRTYAWDWAEAEKEYKRAIELNANHALAHRWYASYLRLLSRHDQAIAEITRARELDPLSPALNATVGFILFSARKHNDAIESLKRTIELDKDYPYTYLFLAFTYSAKGNHSQAIASCQEAMRLGLNTPSTRVFLGTAYANAGEREQAAEVLKQLQSGTDYVSPGDLATLYAALGDPEQAFASLEKAYQTQDPQLQHLGVSPGFDPLRKDPRFKDFLRRVGLPN